MQCENELCIYCKEDECMLDLISIDTFGMCADHIQLTIETELLERAKDDLLQQLHPNEF